MSLGARQGNKEPETTFRPSLTTFSLMVALALLVPPAVAYTPTVSITDSGASTSLYEKFHVISSSYDFTLTTANGGSV